LLSAPINFRYINIAILARWHYLNENINQASKTLGVGRVHLEEFGHVEKHTALLYFWEVFSLDYALAV
jgi:hypothetical protein